MPLKILPALHLVNTVFAISVGHCGEMLVFFLDYLLVCVCVCVCVCLCGLSSQVSFSGQRLKSEAACAYICTLVDGFSGKTGTRQETGMWWHFLTFRKHALDLAQMWEMVFELCTV